MTSNLTTRPITLFGKSSFITKEVVKIINEIINKLPKELSIDLYYFNLEESSTDVIQGWKSNTRFHVHIITSQFEMPTLDENSIVIDALFGFELEAPLQGGFKEVVKYINSSGCTVFSIGAPSGLLPTDNTANDKQAIIKASFTILLQDPPLAFYFTENQGYFGETSIIRLPDTPAIGVPTFTKSDDLKYSFIPRRRFSHKGTYGHGLIVAGAYGMAGAATLSTLAATKSGIGLTTLHCPKENRIIHQIAVPEAILDLDESDYYFTQLIETDEYNAVAIGPGIGMVPETEAALLALLHNRIKSKANTPLIIDADALNLLVDNHEIINNYLKGAILTPHPAELDRLVGHCNNSYIRLMQAINLASRSGSYIILKGAYSILINPDGEYTLNPTGCSGMATAGSGDVLTGILLALAAQGYDNETCIKLGCYIHGKAGEIAASIKGNISMTAQDIANALPQAWMNFEKEID